MTKTAGAAVSGRGSGGGSSGAAGSAASGMEMEVWKDLMKLNLNLFQLQREVSRLVQPTRDWEKCLMLKKLQMQMLPHWQL